MGEYMDYALRLSALGEILRKEQQGRTRVIFTGGGFDIMHKGHYYLLEVAKNLNFPGEPEYYRRNLLVVDIVNDERIRMLKGADKPHIPEVQRAQAVAGLEWVDFTTIHPAVMVNPTIELALELRPNILIQSTTPSDHDLQRLLDAGIRYWEIGRSTGDISSSKIVEGIRASDPNRRYSH